MSGQTCHARHRRLSTPTLQLPYNRQRLGYAGIIGAIIAATSLFIQLPIAFAVNYKGAGEPVPGSSHSLYFEVRLDGRVKLKALRPGDTVSGTLSQDVYAGNHMIFPAGSGLRLTVDRLERRRRERSHNWPWVVREFSPRHENYPTFHAAHVLLPGGEVVPIHVSLVWAGRKVQVHSQPKTIAAKSPKNSNASAAPGQEQARGEHKRQRSAPRSLTLILQASKVAPPETPKDSEGENSSSSAPSFSGPVMLPIGTKARVILLHSLSVSKSHPGASFETQLVEPVRLNSRIVLPEGTLFEGKLEKRTPPRWFSRPGSIHVVFTRLILPSGGGKSNIVGSLSKADMSPGSHSWMGSEGQLRGGRPGTAWMLINLGLTAGFSKVSDDSTQLIIEAVVSTATDASTAGVARIVAACVSGIFMATRRGRDVFLPKYTEMEIALNRPLILKERAAETATKSEAAAWTPSPATPSRPGTQAADAP
jgi:hypothetical protein